MKILILGSFHHKNMIGLKLLLDSIKYEYKFGNSNDINNFDIIYSPSTPINSSQYPNKKFIFGPHFSVFPDNRLLSINNINKNSVYIQPSIWVCELWKNYGAENIIPIKDFPFSVEVEKFCPSQIQNSQKNEVFIYFKSRNPKELEYVKQFLNYKNVTYKIFDYIKKYNEEDYLKCLHNAKYGIIIGRHESQGFAIEEALSCNVPLLIWEVKYMSQEYGYNYPDIPATIIPYWDDRCGEYFYNKEELETTYNKFITKLETYSPREYIIENLSPQKCGQRFIELVASF
jgi:hypothetical protein